MTIVPTFFADFSRHRLRLPSMWVVYSALYFFATTYSTRHPSHYSTTSLLPCLMYIFKSSDCLTPFVNFVKFFVRSNSNFFFRIGESFFSSNIYAKYVVIQSPIPILSAVCCKLPEYTQHSVSSLPCFSPLCSVRCF